MLVHLPPEIRAIVERKVSSGEFATAEAVVVEAVSRLEGSPLVDEDLLVEARRQADAGEVVPLNNAFVDHIASHARE